MELTPLGSLLVDYAHRIQAQLAAAEEDLERLASGGEGPLAVGTFHSVSVKLLPEILRRVRLVAPGVEVRIEEHDTDEVLADGMADCGTMSKRFPFPDNPTGWYRVAFAGEVGPELAPLSLFGRELMIFRDSDGGAHVMAAHCPHLGAHLGYGGRIEQDCVVCPFHGWRYDLNGANVNIPYRDELNRKATIAVYPVREWAGLVMMWFDEAGGLPTWELPTLPELEDDELLWHAPSNARWRIRTHPQEILENTVDIAHFRFVHGVTAFGALSAEEHGPMLRTTAELTLNSPRGPVSGAVVNEMWGLGIDVNRVVGIGKGATIVTVTPIDGEHVDVAYAFLSPRASDGSGISRAGQGHVRDNIAQIEADFPIWEHKVHRSDPALARGEGAIMDFRRWARQFYITAG